MRVKIYNNIVLGIIILFTANMGIISAQEVSYLKSGNVTLQVISVDNNQFGISFIYNDTEIPTLEPGFPVHLEVKQKKVVGKYNAYEIDQNKLVCQAVIKTERGSEFAIKDIYIAKGSGTFELQRSLEVVSAASVDSYFNSLFGFQTDKNCNKITENEYFIPGVWYKANFTTAGNIPETIPQATDTYFYYREDRITLPLVMFRNPETGTTVSIMHKDSDPQTVVADANGMRINENYQYGALGVKQENNIIYTTFIYPGSEAETKNGRGIRFHPVKQGLKQQYNLEIVFSTTMDYATSVKNTWNHAFDLYNPKVYDVDLSSAYDGLIETLLKYYVPSIDKGGIYDAAGFPFQVSLEDFTPQGITYQMGFVGMQIATGYYLFREGVEKVDNEVQVKGESVLNFWANNCLSKLGYPRTWYDPGINGNKGTWRIGSDMHVTTGGMESLIAAWCFAKRNNIDRPQWLDTCKKFGNWLVENQNEDGSYYFTYNHDYITPEGKHPVGNYNKFLTICAVRYLVELYIATNDPLYKTAALKAGEFCYRNIHEQYCYVACVVDNPQTIDGASGQKALYAFLSLYDFTRDPKWLQAAEQAATYTESWVYSFEIPVESDRTENTSFPKDRSIVGQQLIAIGHAAADLGFAWSSFAYYRLYLETGNEHYLHVARIAAHDTKQSMNWDGSLYPGQAKGLQLEAFGVTIPRRMNGVMTTLNWNYAAHLDPMFRFKDAFGTPDLEEVEKMSWQERQRLNTIYSKMQSANYGQDIDTDFESINQDTFCIYPNPVRKNDDLCIDIPIVSSDNYIMEICDLGGHIVAVEKIGSLPVRYTMKVGEVPSGTYILKIKGREFSLSQKIIIQ